MYFMRATDLPRNFFRELNCNKALNFIDVCANYRLLCSPSFSFLCGTNFLKFTLQPRFYTGFARCDTHVVLCFLMLQLL